MPKISKIFRYCEKRGKVVEVKKRRTRPKADINRPIECDASGVAHTQVPEVRQKIDEMGLTSVKCMDDGTMLYEGGRDNQRRQWMEHIGLYDRNAGYRDKAPDNYTGQK